MTASTVTRNQPARPDEADPLPAPMPDWTRAACRGQDPNRWAPAEEQLPDPAARQVCWTCPITDACHTWGTTTGTTGICGGVWLEDGRPASMPTRAGGSRGRQRTASPVRRPA